MREFGEFVQKARLRRGFASQVSFADALGWTQSRVNRVERGVIAELPSPDDLQSISRVTGVPTSDLLESAGYVTEARADFGYVVRPDDPRAELLRIVEGLADDEVRKLTRIVALVIDRATCE